jgi:glycosyltransferase involved in cell wall biosynthesis
MICWIHGTKKFDDNIEGLIGWVRHNVLIPFLYRKSELVTVSEGIRKELIKEYKIKKDRIRYIPNGFDVEAIQKKSHKPIDQQILSLGIQRPIKTLATHCRLARQKNLKAMLDIFFRVKQSEQVRLIILGDGELRDELLDHSEKLGLRTFGFWKQHDLAENYDVYFLGHFDNPYPMVAICDLYLMTSSWEGFPLALCEAMACGVPVMSADCFTGPREVIAPTIDQQQPVDEPLISEHGILMPLAHSDDENQLWSIAVKNILHDDVTRKRLASAGPQRVRNFDLRMIQQQWLELLNE